MASTLVLVGCSTTSPSKPLKRTYSSFDLPSEHTKQDTLSAGCINFQGVPLEQVLQVYAASSGRTVLRGSLPDARISLRSASPLSCIQLLQMLDTVLAQNGIAMVLSGDDAVKAVTTTRVSVETPPEINLPWEMLPDSSSVMMRTVHLKNLKPSETIPMLAPFAHLPNSLIAIDGKQILILRDYSANIRQQLRMLEQLDRKPSP
ncbi:MAG TPA: hypothetical protein DCQ92_10560 [Verrucomicrobia subdivision 3 bacterium]|nr:hypothetical protein [Limisphaerales bacterium]